MSAASQARRRRGAGRAGDRGVRAGPHTSYSACGIPYWISGTVEREDAADLARHPSSTAATASTCASAPRSSGSTWTARTVRARDLDGGREYDEPFDDLVYATGSVPMRPPVPGIDAAGVYGVQTLDDGDALRAALDARPARRVVIVGGGYIGLEMAEALPDARARRHGRRPRPPPRSARSTPTSARSSPTPCAAIGIELVPVRRRRGDRDRTGRPGRRGAHDVRAPAAGRTWSCSGSACARTSRSPATAGIPLGPSGGIAVDHRMRTAGRAASGRPATASSRSTGSRGQRVVVALGTHANKQGRVAGINLGGGYATFPGVIGTAVTKLCDLEVARTGLSEAEAEAAGYRFVTASVDSTTEAGYFPGAAPIRLKLVAEKRHRPAARRADRRPRGRREADRRARDRDLERDGRATRSCRWTCPTPRRSRRSGTPCSIAAREGVRRASVARTGRER